MCSRVMLICKHVVCFLLCAGDKAGRRKSTIAKPTRALKDLLPQTARITCANLAPQPALTVDASIIYIYRFIQMCREICKYIYKR